MFPCFGNTRSTIVTYLYQPKPLLIASLWNIISEYKPLSGWDFKGMAEEGGIQFASFHVNPYEHWR